MASEGLWKIQIERTRDEYHYTIEEPERSTIAFRGTLQVPDSIRQQIVSDFEDLLDTVGDVRSASVNRSEDGGPSPSAETRPEQIGQRIFDFLIPSDCQEYLASIESDFVKISTNDVEIPWELMHDGEEFFAVKNKIGRTIEARKTVSAEGRPDTDEQRALLIGDPGLDLPGAADEVRELLDMFEANRELVADALIQEEATSQQLIFENLENNYYDIIHYAGHTSFDEQNPEQSMIHLNDTEITAQYFLNLLDTPPRLVFLNSCSSSTSGGVEYWEQEGRVSGLASSVIASGVDHYIGAMWPVADAVSQQMSRFFYDQLFDGQAVGTALRTARQRAIEANQDPLSPASFILYGDPRSAATSGPAVSKTKLLNQTSYESSRKLCSQIGLGAVDVGFFGLNQALYRITQGLDIRIIGVSSYSKGGIGIVAAPDSDIETVQDLAGRTVGVATNRESTVNRWLRSTLQAADVDSGAVSTIEMSGTEHYRNIRSNTIDAVVTWDPWKSLAATVGEIVADDSTAENRSYEVIVACETALAKQADDVRSLLNTHFHIVDEIKDAEQYPDTYANRLGIDAQSVGLQDDGYVRPSRADHFEGQLEADLRATIPTELAFLRDQQFVQTTEFDDALIDFSYIPDESPPETIELDTIQIGHNDSLACVTGIERGYYT